MGSPHIKYSHYLVAYLSITERQNGSQEEALRGHQKILISSLGFSLTKVWK